MIAQAVEHHNTIIETLKQRIEHILHVLPMYYTNDDEIISSVSSDCQVRQLVIDRNHDIKQQRQTIIDMYESEANELRAKCIAYADQCHAEYEAEICKPIDQYGEDNEHIYELQRKITRKIMKHNNPINDEILHIEGLKRKALYDFDFDMRKPCDYKIVECTADGLSISVEYNVHNEIYHSSYSLTSTRNELSVNILPGSDLYRMISSFDYESLKSIYIMTMADKQPDYELKPDQRAMIEYNDCIVCSLPYDGSFSIKKRVFDWVTNYDFMTYYDNTYPERALFHDGFRINIYVPDCLPNNITIKPILERSFQMLYALYDESWEKVYKIDIVNKEARIVHVKLECERSTHTPLQIPGSMKHNGDIIRYWLQ